MAVVVTITVSGTRVEITVCDQPKRLASPMAIAMFDKTGEMVLHPLEETVGKVRTLFYEEAEEILSKVPQLGLGTVQLPPEIRVRVFALPVSPPGPDPADPAFLPP